MCLYVILYNVHTFNIVMFLKIYIIVIDYNYNI